MDKIPAQIAISIDMFKKRVSETFDVKKTILFGSFAKGTFNENSDIDICFIVENSDNNFLTMLQIAPLTIGIDPRIETVVFSLEEFMEEQSFGLLREIKKTGIEIK